MRGPLAGLAGLLAVLALAVALPATWVSTHLADEDGFVSLARDVTAADAVRDSAADVVADRLVEDAGLPGGDAVRELVLAAADRALDSRRVSAAWEETLRRTHAAVLSGEASSTGTIPLDLAPLAALVAARTEGLVAAPEQLVVEVPGGPSALTVRAVERSPAVALLAGAVGLGAAAVALVAARRRGAAIAWLGVGAVLVAVADAGLARLVRDRAVTEAGGDGPQGGLVRALVDVGVASFDAWLVWTALAGGLALVVGAAFALVGRRAA